MTADYHYAHRDDPDEWDGGEVKKPSRRLASMFSVRLSPDECASIRAAAEREGMTVSAFLRAAALARATRAAGTFASGSASLVVAGPEGMTW